MAKEIYKNYAEAEEYFKNLGIEYRFSCYHENNFEGCHLLGDYMIAIKNDYIRAAKIFKDNCDNNKFGRSCTEHGNCRIDGYGVDKELNIGLKYYEKGCEFDDPNGCFNAGQLLIGKDPNYEQHIKPDIKKSLNYLEKGCGLDKKDKIFAGECCLSASNLYIHGNYGCEKNMKKAFELSLKACDFGIIRGCTNVSLMYLRGEGTEKNIELGKQYRERVLDYIQQVNSNKGIEFQRTS